MLSVASTRTEPKSSAIIAATGEKSGLVACWKNGPENTPGCEWIIPPAGDCPSQVVGDDYPYKTRFNQVNPEELEWTERPPFSNPQPVGRRPTSS